MNFSFIDFGGDNSVGFSVHVPSFDSWDESAVALKVLLRYRGKSTWNLVMVLLFLGYLVEILLNLGETSVSWDVFNVFS